MSECVNNYFILNCKSVACSKFKDEYVKNGKCVYEVIRIIDGIPLYFEKHIERLKNSCLLSKNELWIKDRDIEKSIYKLTKDNKVKNGNIKLIFNFSEKNNFVAYYINHSYPSEKMYNTGVRTILYHGERHNPNAKIVDNDFRKNVNLEIEKNNVYEAILVDRNGFITEGSKSNIFFVKDDTIVTAPVDKVLPGVTRDVIIELCKRMCINVIEEKINFKELKEYDALFISGTSPKVLPINYVDNMYFDSVKNKLLNSVKDSYDEDVENYINQKKLNQ